MSAEVWQLAVAAGIGAVIILLWLFLVYLPRRTGEDGGNRNRKDDDEDHSDNDR